MGNDFLWPDPSEIVLLNQLIVGDTGEPHALLNEGGLESACARPRNLFEYEQEGRIAHLATSIITALGRNHPFAQGNKRTALAAALLFIQNNGWYLDHPDTEDFGPLIERVIIGEIDESALANELDDYLIEELL